MEVFLKIVAFLLASVTVAVFKVFIERARKSKKKGEEK